MALRQSEQLPDTRQAESFGLLRASALARLTTERWPDWAR